MGSPDERPSSIDPDGRELPAAQRISVIRGTRTDEEWLEFIEAGMGPVQIGGQSLPADFFFKHKTAGKTMGHIEKITRAEQRQRINFIPYTQ